jgi:hypothetical protein
MWSALALCIGILIGYVTSNIEYKWLATRNWGVKLWKEWLLILFIVVLVYWLGVFFPLYKLVNQNGN